MIPECFDMIRKRRERFWWFAGRRDLFARLLRPYMHDHAPMAADLGCGPAANESLHDLLPRRWISADISPASFESWPSQSNNLRLLADASKLPIKDASLSLALLLDVLEHLPDERPVLTEAWRVLAPGGLLLVSVPAHSAFWSWHDEQAGHYRRYSLGQIKALALSAGFDILKARHFNSLLAIPIFFARKLFRTMPPMKDKIESDLSPRFLNGPLRFWLRLENAISDAGIRLPFGTSAVLLLRRKSLEREGTDEP